MRVEYFILGLLGLLFSACQQDESPDIISPSPILSTEGQLELVFKPLYNGQPMVFFQDIATGQQPNEFLYFQRLEFFIAQIRAISAEQTIKLKEVGYVNLSNLVTVAEAQEGIRVILKNVPVGTYEKLAFGIGLNDELNNMDPGDFPTTSPLSRTGNYWYSWNSYIMSKLEGTLRQPNGNNLNFVYHTGISGMYQPRMFDKSFSIAPDVTTTLTIYLHGEDLFYKSGQTISIVDDNFSHSGEPNSRGYDLAKRCLTNIANALNLP